MNVLLIIVVWIVIGLLISIPMGRFLKDTDDDIRRISKEIR